MERNTLINADQVFGADQLLKVTALLYFREALVAQQYETCPELIKTAKKVGVSQEEVSSVISDYLNTGDLGGARRNRIRL